jgi:hypothetical protein
MGESEPTPGASLVSAVLGSKPAAEAGLVVTRGGVEAASAFLSRLCLPATEELGLLFRDEVARWRTARAVEVALKAEARMKALGIGDGVSVHPRLGIAIIDQSSWTDDDGLQDMWAGLLVSSATPDGRDESNLIFTDLLGRMTAAQARVLKFICDGAQKGRTRSGLILPTSGAVLPVAGAMAVTKLADIHQLDRELDHLRTIGLLSGGMNPAESAAEGDPPPPVELAPTPLALQMYARCQGARDPLEFYGLKDATPVRLISAAGFGGNRYYLASPDPE